MDPPTVTLRRAGSRGPIVEVDTGSDEFDRTERALRRAARRGFVTTDGAASMLRVEDVAGAQSAREFLTETDFDEEFVFVDRQSVDQCYDLVLCYVTWSASELRRTYAEIYRDYDVACSADELDRIVRFIRLEGSVDPWLVETGGAITHRDGCPVPPWRDDDRSPEGEGTAPGTKTATTARFVGADR